MHRFFVPAFGWFVILLCLPFVNKAQVSAPNADYTDSTEYVSTELGRDPIFVYTPTRGSYPADELMVAKWEDQDSLNFKWIRFSYTNLAFEDTVLIDTNVSSSEYIGDGDSGYKILIKGSHVDTVLYVWSYVSSFQISDINIYVSTCSYMELKTYLDYDEEGFVYYDWVAGESITKEHTYDIVSWEVEPEGIEIDTTTISPKFEAPVEYTRFTLTIKDNFDQVATSYVDIEEEEEDSDDNTKYLIATEADFEASRAYYPSTETDTSGQAPLSVQFVNNSMNAVEYEWIFYKESAYRDKHESDSVMETTSLEVPADSIIFYTPAYFDEWADKDNGTYDVRLKVKGPVYTINDVEYQCEDEMFKEDYILVDSVFVPQFANVFTPNGDNINDSFFFEGGTSDSYSGTQSVKSFSIKIYSRWGIKVHEYFGDIDDWQGWDGTTAGNIVAKSGVYFYSAFIEGYDGKSYNTTGFVHLFR